MYNYIPMAFSILNICILFISIQNIEIEFSYTPDI